MLLKLQLRLTHIASVISRLKVNMNMVAVKIDTSDDVESVGACPNFLQNECSVVGVGTIHLSVELFRSRRYLSHKTMIHIGGIAKNKNTTQNCNCFVVGTASASTESIESFWKTNEKTEILSFTRKTSCLTFFSTKSCDRRYLVRLFF